MVKINGTMSIKCPNQKNHDLEHDPRSASITVYDFKENSHASIDQRFHFLRHFARAALVKVLAGVSKANCAH
jgi:hypothetical protein